MACRLICLRGARERDVFELEEENGERPEWTIGRGGANRIELADLEASRNHAVLRPAEGGAWEIEDLGSKNGTLVNREPVGVRRLEAGDHVRIGDTVFLYVESAGEGPGEVSVEAAPWGVTSTHQVRDTETWARNPSAAGVEQRNHLEALLRIAGAMEGWQSLEGLQRELVKHVVEWVPADRGAVLVLNPETGETGTNYGWRRCEGSAQVAVSRSVIEQVRQERTAILGSFPHGIAPVSESVQKAGIRSLIAAPMVERDRVVGLLYLDTVGETRPLTEEALQFAAAVAAMAAQPLESARRIEQLEAEKRRLESDLGRGFDMIGDSAPMQKVYQALVRIAPADSTVLILGETGSGKELAARAIHARSRRAQGPFVAINCAAIAENLLESELFGHERGAFTGAVAQKRGKIELADGGTLFLDEIGELPMALQAKLLRVLEEREIERVGGTRRIPVNLRLVAATHRDLPAMIEEGTFRRDLYYRLNVVALRLPALRERTADIPLLAAFFLERLAAKAARAIRGFSPEARAALLAHHWPGNVRELQNVVERAVVLGHGEWIEPADLPEEIGESQPAAAEGAYHARVLEAKRRIIEGAMAEAQGRYVEAARILGIHVKHLHRLMRSYGLKEA
jgi:transcriptional regulator with GAF, ATPase, and Fis domain